MSQPLICANDLVVTCHYIVKNEHNVEVDKTPNDAPFSFLFGSRNIVQGLEEKLEGKPVGWKGSITVENAYGDSIIDLCQEVPRDLFIGLPDDVKLEVGLNFVAETQSGPIPVRVTKIEDDRVTVDANVSLAGLTLTYWIEILDIRKATIEELAVGHPLDAEDPTRVAM